MKLSEPWRKQSWWCFVLLNLVPSVIIRPFKLNFDSKCCNDPLFFKRSSKPEGTYTKCFSKTGIACEKNSGREHQQQFETRSCVGCRWAKVMSLFLFFFIFISNYFVPLSTSSSVVVLLAHRLIHPTLKPVSFSRSPCSFQLGHRAARLRPGLGRRCVC